MFNREIILRAATIYEGLLRARTGEEVDVYVGQNLTAYHDYLPMEKRLRLAGHQRLKKGEKLPVTIYCHGQASDHINFSSTSTWRWDSAIYELDSEFASHEFALIAYDVLFQCL